MAGTTKKTTAKKITLSDKLYQDISRYCQMNDIKDVESFIGNCLMQGYNIVKFGYTPKDNLRRELLGIKEPESVITDKPIEQKEKKKEPEISKRKIRVIKKD